MKRLNKLTSIFIGTVMVLAFSSAGSASSQEANTINQDAIKFEGSDYLTVIQARILIAQGQALLNMGRYREALATSDRVLAIKPTDYQAWEIRGNALNKLGRDREAVTAYEQALKLLQQPQQKSVPGNNTAKVEKQSEMYLGLMLDDICNQNQKSYPIQGNRLSQTESESVSLPVFPNINSGSIIPNSEPQLNIQPSPIIPLTEPLRPALW
ncbi:MAG: hypothetical protein RLZZ507_113 [Cyanobacteriota bacterium]|jgi:tetratricopeptide (TPR) repeat protein